MFSPVRARLSLAAAGRSSSAARALSRTAVQAVATTTPFAAVSASSPTAAPVRSVVSTTPALVDLLSSDVPPALRSDAEATLADTIEPDSFLVAHPLSRPGDTTVLYVVACSADRGVLVYELPAQDVKLQVPSRSAGKKACGAASVPSAAPAAGAATGDYATKPLCDVMEEVKEGKWMVVKHRDPWALLSDPGPSPWHSLVSSVGGHIHTTDAAAVL